MKTPMQKANVELRIQTCLFLTAMCQKNRNKNQSQLQREGLIQEWHWKTEFAKTSVSWKLKSWRRTQLCWGLNFYGHLPFWPWGPDCLRSNLLTGPWFLLTAPPVCLVEKALHSPCSSASKAHWFKVTFWLRLTWSTTENTTCFGKKTGRDSV